MEIKDNWRIEGFVSHVKGNFLNDRLGFRTKETSGSDWVNGNVPWFIKTYRTDIGVDVWGRDRGSMSDGWVLPDVPTVLNGTTYGGDSGVNSFIPINYVGDAQIICWHFWSDTSHAYSGWEIKITRVAISDNTGSGNAGSGNAVTCTGNGVYNITNTGSITCR